MFLRSPMFRVLATCFALGCSTGAIAADASLDARYSGDGDPPGTRSFASLSATQPRSLTKALLRRTDGITVIVAEYDGATTQGSSFGITTVERNGEIDGTELFNDSPFLATRNAGGLFAGIDSQNRVYVAGAAAGDATFREFAVARILTTGGSPRIDPTYGVNGIARVSPSSSTGNFLGAFAVDGSGRAHLGAGVRDAAGRLQPAVTRLTTSGTPDTGFGIGGTARLSPLAIDPTMTLSFVDSLRVRSTGGVDVIGFTLDATDGLPTRLLAGRLLASGALDPTYCASGCDAAVPGVQLLNFANENASETVGAVSYDSAGLVIAGTTSGAIPQRQACALLRLRDDGRPDATFGGNGRAIFDLGPAGAGCRVDAAVAQRVIVNGRVAGEGTVLAMTLGIDEGNAGIDQRAFIGRFDRNGQLDASFVPDDNGLEIALAEVPVDTPSFGGGTQVAARALVVDDDGLMVAVDHRVSGNGAGNPGDDQRIVVARFSDALLRNSFD